MVIILPGQKKSSGWGAIGAGFGKGLGEGIESAQEKREMEKSQDVENEAAKRLGIDLTGIRDPKIRQDVIKQSLQKMNASEKYKAQYDAKAQSQMELMQKLGLGSLFQNKSNPQSLNNESQNRPQMNDEGDIDIGNVELPTHFPEEQIYKMAMVNPAIADKMQKHNDTLKQDERHAEQMNLNRSKHKDKQVSESYKENESFINGTFDKYEDALRRDAILGEMENLEESGNLSESGIVNLLETVGLKPEWLKNPANEEYTKLGLDLLGGGSLQADYGSRVLQSEFAVSQQRIPTLSQTAEGRKQIKENIRTMLLPSKLKQERMQYYLDKAERTGEPLPHNLRGKILSDIKPELEKVYDDFKQRNGRYKVREGTQPDDNAIEKYFFLSKRNEEKAIKMMKEDGYDVE